MTDADLVSAFVKGTSGYSLREAGEFVGVSHNTVAKWRKGDVAELQPATRRALESYLSQQEESGGEPDADARLDELMRTKEGLELSAALVDFALAQRSIALRDLARAQRVETETAARRERDLAERRIKEPTEGQVQQVRGKGSTSSSSSHNSSATDSASSNG